jgi:hypothetical protein
LHRGTLRFEPVRDFDREFDALRSVGVQWRRSTRDDPRRDPAPSVRDPRSR